MRSYGDIPTKHRELVEELEKLEVWINEYRGTLEETALAKGFVSMAHDYYAMDMEEIGDFFLKEALDSCPTYFTHEIYEDIETDLEFSKLIYQMRKTLGWEILLWMGFKE